MCLKKREQHQDKGRLHGCNAGHFINDSTLATCSTAVYPSFVNVYLPFNKWLSHNGTCSISNAAAFSGVATKWIDIHAVPPYSLQVEHTALKSGAVLFMTRTVNVGCNVESGSTDAGRAAACLEPVALHGGNQVQGCVHNLVHLLAEVEGGCKAVQVEAGVHRPAAPHTLLSSEASTHVASVSVHADKKSGSVAAHCEIHELQALEISSHVASCCQEGEGKLRWDETTGCLTCLIEAHLGEGGQQTVQPV